MAPAFAGFSSGSLKFLSELAENNHKSWFESQRANFEKLLMTPLRADRVPQISLDTE